MTGGTGLLGSEILKLDHNIVAPVAEELNILNRPQIEAAFLKYEPQVVLHLAAATNPSEHEKNPGLGIEVNISGTANIASACLKLGIKLVYTSSDYLYVGAGPHKEDEPVFAPSKFYWSKLGGESAVQMLPDHLILRLSFGPVPFPWEEVYAYQWTSKLYVDEIAPIVLSAARSGAQGIMNIGGPRTTLEAYALRTRKDIRARPKPDWVPADTSLDLTKMKRELGIADETKLLKH